MIFVSFYNAQYINKFIIIIIIYYIHPNDCSIPISVIKTFSSVQEGFFPRRVLYCKH